MTEWSRDAISPDAGDQIEVFLAFTDACDTEAMDRKYGHVLQSHERERASHFYFEHDRKRDLITRMLIRSVLSRYTGRLPGEIHFTQNIYGKPELAESGGNRHPIRFNLSHTAGLVALALTRNREIGIDVENIRERCAALEIADRFFAPAEVTALEDLPLDARNRRFFDYWTLKEAYIKARGMGLSLDLSKFAFRFTEPFDVVIDFADDFDDAGNPWWFWQFEAAPAHIGAICVERLSVTPPQISFRTVVPFVSEEAFFPTMTRQSPYEIIDREAARH